MDKDAEEIAALYKAARARLSVADARFFFEETSTSRNDALSLAPESTPDACHHCRETFQHGQTRYPIADAVRHGNGWASHRCVWAASSKRRTITSRRCGAPRASVPAAASQCSRRSMRAPWPGRRVRIVATSAPIARGAAACPARCLGKPTDRRARHAVSISSHRALTQGSARTSVGNGSIVGGRRHEWAKKPPTLPRGSRNN
jgi:hypothetical protein